MKVVWTVCGLAPVALFGTGMLCYFAVRPAESKVDIPKFPIIRDPCPYTRSDRAFYFRSVPKPPCLSACRPAESRLAIPKFPSWHAYSKMGLVSLIVIGYE